MRLPLSAALIAAAAPAAAFELSLPIACTPGLDCAVQHYVDRDPGPDRLDYRCGHQTYDGHDGVDIRLVDLKAMEAGVAVLAAAGGTVRATRDEMPDRDFTEDPEAVKDRECGNGVLIDHPGGWQTQYCHMKLGSIAVSPGDTVETGARLGEVGLSGMTEFPHVHFTVRKDGEEVDPFATAPAGAAATCAVAGEASRSIWSPAAMVALAYRPAFVLNAGFSDAPVAMDDIEAGLPADSALTTRSPAIVFYGRAIGLEVGDIQRVRLFAPDGSVFAENEVAPLDRPKAQYFAFVGKTRRDAPWPAGTWRGRYSVIRDGAEVASREVTAVIGE
jgi:hypothetical protein